MKSAITMTQKTSQQLAWIIAFLTIAIATPLLNAQTPAKKTPPKKVPPPAVFPNEAAPITDAEFHVPIDAETKKLVTKLIKQLAAITYQVREKSAYHLIGIGTPAFPQLRTAYHQADDLEVSLQIERIIYEGYINAHLRNKYGFLGIEKDRRRLYLTHKDRQHIPEGHAGIQIASIIQDGGAQRAGIIINDIILALDGEPMSQDVPQLWENFANKIKSKGPGAEVTLKILRGTQTLYIKSVLGRMPLARINNVPGMGKKLQETIDRFSIWWETYFREPSTTK
ncbi:PDZ domain-containing protein [bacterium AH-315-J04]|nr:PDZ domain-containing protein [bacterium AH-315-J04]